MIALYHCLWKDTLAFFYAILWVSALEYVILHGLIIQTLTYLLLIIFFAYLNILNSGVSVSFSFLSRSEIYSKEYAFLPC